MDAAWSSSAFLVLKGVLDIPHLTGTPGRGWTSVKCASKKAYGCGKHGQGLVAGLNLYVRHVFSPDLTSTLSIRLNDNALRCIEAELDAPRIALEAEGAVKIANEQLLVLILVFRRQHFGQRVYYLVYDCAHASLDMIPHIPDDLQATYTMTPVPERTADGQGYELALMVRKFWRQSGDRGRLCVFSPANPAPDDGAGPWQIKVQRFPELSEAFSADVMFSHAGKVFWGDLSQGLAYSDLRSGSSDVDEPVFINLPRGYKIRFSDLPDEGLIEPVKMSRTMGCVGGSIKFVCIHRFSACPGEEWVKVWTLDLENREWNEEEGSPYSWKKLQKHVRFMGDELRDVEPQYPVLMPDGGLCFLLYNTRMKKRDFLSPHYICSFDMLNKRPNWFGITRSCGINGPIVLPYIGFKKCFPPHLPREWELPAREQELPARKRELPELKRELPARKRELPSISWQTAKH